MIRWRQSLPAMQVWWLGHSLAMHKRAGKIYVGLWLFSRVWFACSGKYLWIQLTNVSAHCRTERFFDTLSQRWRKQFKCTFTHEKKIVKKTREYYMRIPSVRLWSRCCCLPLRLKRVDLSLGSRENSHRRFVYYFCHTLMEIAVFIK